MWVTTDLKSHSIMVYVAVWKTSHFVFLGDWRFPGYRWDSRLLKREVKDISEDWPVDWCMISEIVEGLHSCQPDLTELHGTEPVGDGR